MRSYELKAKNDLKALVLDTQKHKKCTIQFWFKAGSALEKSEDLGTAHFLEHMFFKGTQKYPGIKLTKEIEKVGGEVNAFTSFNYTCYYINCPSSELIHCLKIITDMVSNPLFTKSEIESEINVVLEELKRTLDSPSNFQFLELQKQCFSKGYDHPILGNSKTIKNFNQEKIKNFRHKHYNTKNAFLIIAGGVGNNLSKIEKTINAHAIPQGLSNIHPQFKLENKNVFSFHEKDISHPSLLLSFPSEDLKSNNLAAELLAFNCLAYGESSLLHKELIGKNSTASSLAYSNLNLIEGGLHNIKLTFPMQNAEKVFDILKQNIEKTIHKGFKTKDIEKIKNQYIAYKIYNKELLEGFASNLGHSYALTDDIYIEDKLIEVLKNTSEDEVYNAFVKIFTRNPISNIQVPLKTTLKQKTTLKKLNIKTKKVKKKLEEKNTGEEYSKKVLAKGIEFIHRQDNFTPTFSMHILIKSGLSNETKNDNGIHNLLANTLVKQYIGLKEEKLKFELENHSTSLSSFAGKNAYGITLHGLSSFFKSQVKHALNVVFNNSIPQKVVNNEKKIVLRDIENKSKNPVSILFKNFHEDLFEGHNYSYEIIGTKQSIKNINSRELNRLHGRNIKSKKIVISFSGSVPKEDVLNEIIKFKKALIPRTDKKIKKTSRMHNRSFIKHIPLDREQTHIMLGIPCNNLGSKEENYIKILTNYLSGQSSPLFVEIRDKLGLCYTVSPIHFNALEKSYWGIYIGTSKEKKDLSIDKISHLISHISNSGLSSTDFQNTLKMIKGHYQLSYETNEDYASSYGIHALFNLGIDYSKKQIDQISKIKRIDLNNFLKKFLSKKTNITSVGLNN